MSNPRPDQPPVNLAAVCRCLTVTHEHGQLYTYTKHGCRCRQCKAAKRAYTDRRRRDIAYGRRPARVPTIGARRRLQALACLGWTADDVARRIGMQGRYLGITLRRQATITADLHGAIAAIYEELWDQQAPPSHDGRSVRAVAARLGWVPPMAWDDIDHDDAPSLGDTAVRTGRGAVSRIHPDDIAWMLRSNATSWAAAERLGISRAYLLELAQRHGIDIPAHIRVGDDERAQLNRERRVA